MLQLIGLVCGVYAAGKFVQAGASALTDPELNRRAEERMAERARKRQQDQEEFDNPPDIPARFQHYHENFTDGSHRHMLLDTWTGERYIGTGMSRSESQQAAYRQYRENR